MSGFAQHLGHHRQRVCKVVGSKLLDTEPLEAEGLHRELVVRTSHLRELSARDNSIDRLEVGVVGENLPE